jgi:hypothetical protein
MERPAGSAFRRRSSPESSAGSQPEPTAAKTTSAKPGGADSRCLRQQLPPLNGLTSAFSATLRLQHDWCVPQAEIARFPVGEVFAAANHVRYWRYLVVQMSIIVINFTEALVRSIFEPLTEAARP